MAVRVTVYRLLLTTTVPPLADHTVGAFKLEVCNKSYVWQVTGHERITFAPLSAIARLGAGSETVTLNAHWLLLPLVLLAVHVTVVVPAAKLEPLAGTHVTVVSGQLSTTEAVKLTI